MNTKLATLAKKAELKEHRDKIIKLKSFGSIYFHGKNLFVDDGFQNMFGCQPTFNTFELKKTKALIMILYGKKKFYLNLKFPHCMTLSYPT